MMARIAVALAICALLAGCGEEAAEQKAAEDARDVAIVKRMSREPFQPIEPTPISQADVTRYGLDRPGCRFSKNGQDPIFIAAQDEGFMRVGTDLKRFAARTESATLPGGARSTYVGLASWVDLARLPDAGGTGDANTWPARLIVHDAQDRVAYMADGTIRCREG